MHHLKEYDVVDTKKEVLFVTIPSTKTHKVVESLVCEGSHQVLAVLIVLQDDLVVGHCH